MTHRRLPSFVAVAALALVLSACQITITPGPTWPPSLAGTLTAQVTSNPTAQASDTLSPGAVRYYRVNVPEARGLLYGEVSDVSGLRVSLLGSSGSLQAVSDTRAYFAASVAGLSMADLAADVGGSSIDVAFACVGPCAAVVPSATTYYIAVANVSGSTRSYDVFAYTMDETDLNEPNDASLSPTPLVGAGSDLGAIEVLGDVDYFEYEAVGGGAFYVVFTPYDLDLGLELDIVGCTECVVLDGTSGRQVEGLLDGDVLRVRSAAGRAGPSATSGYAIEVTASPPVSAVSTR
jgi:hypothetical protein